MHDRNLIIPLVLVVILVILVLLLRAVVAPLLLVGTVVLSFGATLGVSALLFNHVLKLPGADPAVPLFGFVFLVALGIGLQGVVEFAQALAMLGRNGDRGTKAE